ncbi:MAG: DUF427 domain-containing protein [Solirubrobacteraceae bacterium]|nr:DUF427 domain-containing protein [Solirubrobacteraceae bacterium]
MPRATFNGETIAESDETIVVEGNHYFPPSSVNEALLQGSDTHTVCPWKGTASYKSVVVGGEQAADGAWYYPQAKDEAKNIEGYYAFWKGVEVSD